MKLEKMTVRNVTRKVNLAERADIADSMWKLLVGLIPYRSLAQQGGLVLPRTGSIHTTFLRFPIDVMFLDSKGIIIGMRQEVKPFRVAIAPRGTRTTVELPASCLRSAACVVGDLVVISKQAEFPGLGAGAIQDSGSSQ
ncbi:MAG: DUF192 domain-containing protein [Armatimonadota bacterium]|nr:DUF192 domain-containing protein [Armatimonadota bacterium]